MSDVTQKLKLYNMNAEEMKELYTEEETLLKIIVSSIITARK